MRILIACEFSGLVREAFTSLGHETWSCDMEETEIPGKHIKGDVLQVIRDGWDLMIAHPPCTYLCNSGVRWLHSDPTRFGNMLKAADFFNALKNCEIPKIVLENPIPHKYAKYEIGVYDQIIHPWEHGHGETKATCLWLKNVPKLCPSSIVEGRDNKIHNMPPSSNRARDRSRTYTGIAQAMSAQWG